MTVTTAETNSDDIQGTEIAIIPVDESDNKNKLCRPVDKEFCGLELASSGIALINALIMLCLWPLSVIQLSGWKNSFGENSNPAIKTQYDQMQSSFHLHFDIILVSLYSLQISIIGFRGLITIWRKLRWINILIPLSIIACFSAVCVAFIFPSKPAEEFAQEILKDEYALTKIPISLVYSKFFCISASVQHIFLITMILWLKPKDFPIIFHDNQRSTSSLKAVTNKAQTISQEKTDKICENDYVLC